MVDGIGLSRRGRCPRLRQALDCLRPSKVHPVDSMSIPIIWNKACCSGPYPLVRKSPSSIWEVCPPDGMFARCRTNTLPDASLHRCQRSPFGLLYSSLVRISFMSYAPLTQRSGPGQIRKYALDDPIRLSDLDYREAIDALIAGEIDVAMVATQIDDSLLQRPTIAIPGGGHE
jgi:hypothetical protein